MNDLYKNYLIDLCDLLCKDSLVAKIERDTEQSDFTLGKLMAYYSVISLIQSQAIAFGISLTEIKLDKIDPDKDLL